MFSRGTQIEHWRDKGEGRFYPKLAKIKENEQINYILYIFFIVCFNVID